MPSDFIRRLRSSDREAYLQVPGARGIRNLGETGIALLISVSMTSCSSAAPQFEQKNTTFSAEPTIATLFESGVDVSAIRMPTGLGAAKVCATSNAMLTFYTGRGVQAVTGSTPFAPVSGPSDICHVRITSTAGRGRDLFASSSCRVQVLSDGKVDIVIAPGTKNEFAAAECFYRLALVLEGYSGGLTAPVFGEYPNSFYFAGKRNYVGPIVAPVIQDLIRKCDGVVNRYYSHDLRDFVHTKCNVD